MTARAWKAGDSCVWRGRWGVVSYLLGGGRGILSLDDYGQQSVQLSELSDPRIEIGPLVDLKDQRGGHRHGTGISERS